MGRKNSQVQRRYQEREAQKAREAERQAKMNKLYEENFFAPEISAVVDDSLSEEVDTTEDMRLSRRAAKRKKYRERKKAEKAEKAALVEAEPEPAKEEVGWFWWMLGY